MLLFVISLLLIATRYLHVVADLKHCFHVSLVSLSMVILCGEERAGHLVYRYL